MMRPDFHPRFQSDVDRIENHIGDVTGDLRAAYRRLVEINALIDEILDNPMSGNRLGPDFREAFVRHGGRDRKIAIVFKPDPAEGVVRFYCVAFGGADWFGFARERL